MTEVKVLVEGMHKDKVEENKIITHPICSTVVLIKGKKNIIIDPGAFGFEGKVIKKLKEEGLKPEDIDYVLNTHYHYDHISNNYLFKNAKLLSYPNAIWYIGENKLDYYTDKTIPKIPEIEIIETPGHEPKHISFIVKVKDKKYIIAGDAILHRHFKKEFKSEVERESVKKILSLNPDIIIPGHGQIIEKEGIEKLRKVVG